MIRTLNLPITDEAVFAALTARRHPLGMRASKPTYQLVRETYFDTDDGALQDRRMTLRIRREASGREALELSIAEESSLQGIVQSTTLDTPVVNGGLYATLSESSEVASRVREVVDPDALRPQAALDVDREIRELRSGFFGRVTHRIAFDELIAHAPNVTRALQEVTITEVSKGPTSLEVLGARLRDAYGVGWDGFLTYGRVRSWLGPKSVLAPEPPADVRVALMMMRDWEVALVEAPTGFQLPSARGSGEELAREYLAEISGNGAPDGAELDLVGFATARRGGSDLEVWLHESVRGAQPGGFVWIPLLELMERLGGPRLRDRGLIATMLMLVRSEIGQRLLREAPQRRTSPRELPTESRDTGLKAGRGPDDFLDLELSGSKVVVGGGPQLDSLQRLYPEAHFLGPKFGEELAAVYAACDVFVFPSLTDTFGLVMLEALASGLPVAAFPVPGPLDVIGHSGAGVLDDDLAVAARRALEVSPESCREYALTYSWRHTAERFLSYLAPWH